MRILVIKIHFEMDRGTKGEDAALHRIYKWANEVFPSGYTIYKTKGVWRGKARESFTVERYDRDLGLAKDARFITKVRKLAKNLKQTEILITSFEADMKNVTSSHQ